MKTLSVAPLVLNKTSTRVEIDLSALRHNFLTLKNLAYSRMVTGSRQQMELIPIIKADAYGHGMIRVAQTLSDLGASFLGVSNVEEAIRLRDAGIGKEIIVMEATLPDLAEAIVDYRLTPVICTMELARELDSYAQSLNAIVSVHVKVDSGMGRLGVALEDALSFLEQLKQFSQVTIKGLCTHFPSADTDDQLTREQIKKFVELVEKIQARGMPIPYIHAANSVGMVNATHSLFNLARPGLMLYGLYPHTDTRTKIHLKPVMSIKTQIIFLKKLMRGQGISYGHTFIAPRDMMIATLPIGYNDGYLRALSNRAYVLVDGQPCPVVGRVTMDQIMVDVSQVSHPVLGDPVVILGEQNDQMLTADDMAQWADTINYEIICSLGNRLPRVYLS